MVFIYKHELSKIAKKAMVVLPSKISASLSYFYLSWTNILNRDNAYLTSFGVGHKIYKK